MVRDPEEGDVWAVLRVRPLEEIFEAGTLGHIDEVAPVVAISLEVLPHRRVVVGRSLARLDEVILRTRGEEAEDE